MALFERFNQGNQLIKIVREEPVSSEPAENFMKLIVGLGNVGKKYDGTRHNVGFMALDTYATNQGFPEWQEQSKFKGSISELYSNGQKTILLKPSTYMNGSGEAVQAIKAFYKLTNTDITVIHDELDLPFSTVRLKKSGGSAGNNGIKSLIEHIGQDFTRIRIGVANELKDKMEGADFVLAKFSKDEASQLPEVIKSALALLEQKT